MTEAVISLEQLRFAWPGTGVPCLDIDTMQVERGATVLLRGPSGSGKSTLLALLGGVLTPASGRLTILGQDMAKLSPSGRDRFRADHIGMLFQQFNLITYLPVIDNVLLPCRFSRRRHDTAGKENGTPAQAAARLLESLDIDPSLWRRQVTRLSVGQQQRVAIARAMIGHPELIIADEPTSALDAARRDAFVTLLLAQCERAGATLLFASHDDELAPRFGRVIDLPVLNRAAGHSHRENAACAT